MTWSDIGDVVIQGNQQDRAGLGINCRCLVRLREGRHFAFSGHTTNVADLAARLHAAVHDRIPPTKA